jgi:hypothetical protein
LNCIQLRYKKFRRSLPGLWNGTPNELSHQAQCQIEYYATFTVVKMSINLDSNPPPDLSGRRLDAATKRKLVAETHADGSNYFTVMEKYNLKHSTLRGYYKRVKRELPIFKSNGRPSKVDSIGREVVLNFLTENPTTEKRIFTL